MKVTKNFDLCYYEGEAQNGKLRIDVSRLKKGNYYVHIQEAGKALTKMPILIE